MDPLSVGIIGCGRPWGAAGATGFGMGRYHALGYAAVPDSHLVALADLHEPYLREFQAVHGGERLYTDYREMLANERLDIVSICTWTGLHAEMVTACVEAGVRAIHCEKPMAPTFGEARQMTSLCQERGVKLTFNHQRRFGALYCAARDLLRSGAVGRLLRIEASCPDLFDWGTHWFDMMHFYNDETPAAWVLGQVDVRNGATMFGITLEGQGISRVEFVNGVEGLLETSSQRPFRGVNRLIGDTGIIEVQLHTDPALRILGQGTNGWRAIELPEGRQDDLAEPLVRAIVDVVDALRSGRESQLSAAHALRAAELSFATYESSRRRGRVDLPLTITDSPLRELLTAENL